MIDDCVMEIIQSNKEEYAIKLLLESLVVKHKHTVSQNREMRASLKAIWKISKDDDVRALCEVE